MLLNLNLLMGIYVHRAPSLQINAPSLSLSGAGGLALRPLLILFLWTCRRLVLVFRGGILTAIREDVVSSRSLCGWLGYCSRLLLQNLLLLLLKSHLLLLVDN
jgi:hypothetical protein